MPTNDQIFLDVRRLVVQFSTTRGFFVRRKVSTIRAVDDVSFGIRQGETMCLVGESGCGKTTIGRAIVGLEHPVSGSISLKGAQLIGLDRRRSHSVTRQMQMVFQDPYSSLNPRMTVGESIAEPLVIHHVGSAGERRERVRELLDAVGLRQEAVGQLPYQFSGGQRQRIALARALALNPELLVLDEPTSALDVSIQAQILNLLGGLRQKYGLTYLFISHDLAVVRWLSGRVVVMYLGRIMETAPSDTLFRTPMHPYTVALLSAVPVPDPIVAEHRKRISLQGEIPSAANIPAGCRFADRCWLYRRLGNPERCRETEPDLLSSSGEHLVACHFVEEALGCSGSLASPVL